MKSCAFITQENLKYCAVTARFAGAKLTLRICRGIKICYNKCSPFIIAYLSVKCKCSREKYTKIYNIDILCHYLAETVFSFTLNNPFSAAYTLPHRNLWSGFISHTFISAFKSYPRRSFICFLISSVCSSEKPNLQK